MMADDIMELSSDHGLHGGDNVDFEFELTAPTGDDDAMLDTTYNTDLTLSPHPYQGVGHDDLMIDEEDHTTSHMYDVDLANEAGDQDLEAMSFTSIEASHIDDHINHKTTEHLEVDVDLEIAGRSDQQQALVEHNDTVGTEADVVGEAGELEETEIDYEEDNVDTKDFAPQAQFDQAPRENSSLLRSPREQVPDGGVPLKSTSEHSNPKSHHQDGFEADILSHGTTSAIVEIESQPQLARIGSQNEEVARSSVEVVVLYKSNDYALFSSSELDDPDSFFLSDRSISDKPLSDLFAAIRGIITAEVGEEEELCLGIKALELEVEEVSSSLQDVTFTQILALYEELLLNEGIESQPLYIELCTRRAFSIRFANLSAAAAEGKGLSEFTTWHENTDSLTDNGEAEPSGEPIDTPLEEEQLGDVLDGENPKQSNKEDGADATDSEAKGPETADNQNNAVQVQRSTKVSSPTTKNLASGRSNSTYTAAAATTATEAGNALDQEDLIDYSDVELDHGSENPRLVKSDTDKTGDGIPDPFDEDSQLLETLTGDSGEGGLDELKYDDVAEYSGITRENDLGDGADHYAQHDTTQRGACLSALDGSGVGHEYDEQTPLSGIHDSEELYPSHENYDGYGDGEQHEETHETGADYTEYSEEKNDTLGSGNAVGRNEEVDNFDLGNEDWADPSVDFAQDQPTVHSDSAETAESSATVSPNNYAYKADQEEVFIDLPTKQDALELRVSVGTGTEDPEDEIDYEDDDQEEVRVEEPNVPMPNEDKTYVNGKRPRAESEHEDLLENKDAKRPRSRS